MILDDGPRSASVMTLEPSRFSVVTTEQFKQFLAQNPDTGLELIKSLIHRVRALTKTVGNLGLLDVYGRVSQKSRRLPGSAWRALPSVNFHVSRR